MRALALALLIAALVTLARAQSFEVSLEPAELGRVDVRIEVGADKKVHAVLAAHDSASLSDLMKGSRSLEASLKDAGVDLAENGLKFELSADSGGANNQGRSGFGHGGEQPAWPRSTFNIPLEADAASLASSTRNPTFGRAGRLNLVA